MLDYSEKRIAKTEAKWFESVMKLREDAFLEIFGPPEPAEIMTPVDDLAINWPGGGVFTFPPQRERTDWHYVTHGLSQPFDYVDFSENVAATEPVGSGYGMELVLSTTQPEEWPYPMLMLLVRYILGSGNAIEPGHRLPATDLMNEGKGGHLVAATSTEYETTVLTPAGGFNLHHLVGITAGEAQQAKKIGGTEGSEILLGVLQEYGLGLATDRNRECITKRQDFKNVWAAVRKKLASTAGDG